MKKFIMRRKLFLIYFFYLHAGVLMENLRKFNLVGMIYGVAAGWLAGFVDISHKWDDDSSFTPSIFVGIQKKHIFTAQFYEDKRCRCICPNPSSIINSTLKTDRTLYIAYVPPSQCNCDDVILPRVSDMIRDNAAIFCPRCDCKYETRNTTVIMVVVILVVWVLMLLSGYLIFLMILELLVSRKKTKLYQAALCDEAQNPLMLSEDLEDNL